MGYLSKKCYLGNTSYYTLTIFKVRVEILTCWAINMLMMANTKVARSPVLAGIAVIGTRKLICDERVITILGR